MAQPVPSQSLVVSGPTCLDKVTGGGWQGELSLSWLKWNMEAKREGCHSFMTFADHLGTKESTVTAHAWGHLKAMFPGFLPLFTSIHVAAAWSSFLLLFLQRGICVVTRHQLTLPLDIIIVVVVLGKLWTETNTGIAFENESMIWHQRINRKRADDGKE